MGIGLSTRKIEKYRLNLVKEFNENCNWPPLLLGFYSEDIKRIRAALDIKSNYAYYLNKTPGFNHYSSEEEKWNAFSINYQYYKNNTSVPENFINDPSKPFFKHSTMIEPDKSWIRDRLILKACMGSMDDKRRDRSLRVLYWLAKAEGKINQENKIEGFEDPVLSNYSSTDNSSLFTMIKEIGIPDANKAEIIEGVLKDGRLINPNESERKGAGEIFGFVISTPLAIAVLIIVFLFILWYFFQDTQYLQPITSNLLSEKYASF